MSNSKAFTVYIYEQEKRYLEWLVLQRQNIETGGDLFGLWQNENIVIVQLILGPGKCCTRTETSFYQDIEYLSSVGNELTTSQGLCNIGEWHSHHRIDLPSPSQGDQTTVWNHMDSIAGGRFLVFIASITGSKKQPHVNIGCFMFSSETRKMSEGSLVALQGSSPIRGQFNDVSFEPGPEKGVSWGTFVEAVKASQNMKNKRMLAHGNSVEDENGLKSTQKRNPNKSAVTLGNRHNHETTSAVEDLHESQPGKEHRREKTRDVTDKTRLTSSTPSAKYGSTKSVRSKSTKKKTKKNSEGHDIIDEVITTPPEDPFNRPLRDVTSPTPSSGNNDRNKSTSIYTIGNRHNHETTSTVEDWNESQPGKERRGREKTRDFTDKTRLISSTPNETYGSTKNVPNKSTKKKTKKKGITTPPEDQLNRQKRDVTSPTPPSDNNDRNKWTSIFCCCKYEDVTSPTPPSDNNDRNKWTSIFCCCKYEDVTSPTPPSDNNDRNKWTSIFCCCKYDKLNDEEKTTMLRK